MRVAIGYILCVCAKSVQAEVEHSIRLFIQFVKIKCREHLGCVCVRVQFRLTHLNQSAGIFYDKYSRRYAVVLLL